MKLSTIILSLLLLITFLPPIQIPLWNNPKEFEFDYLSNEGYIAYVVNSYDNKKPDDAPKTECECKGTGTITHGDGHKTPCPYVNPQTGKCEFGKKTTEDKNISKEMQVPRKQILFFSAEWCGPCKSFKQNELVRFKDSWKVGTNADDYIRIVDVDTNPQLFTKYNNGKNSIPLFVMLEDEKVVGRLDGYRTAEEIYELWNKK